MRALGARKVRNCTAASCSTRGAARVDRWDVHPCSSRELSHLFLNGLDSSLDVRRTAIEAFVLGILRMAEFAFGSLVELDKPAEPCALIPWNQVRQCVRPQRLDPLLAAEQLDPPELGCSIRNIRLIEEFVVEQHDALDGQAVVEAYVLVDGHSGSRASPRFGRPPRGDSHPSAKTRIHRPRQS